MHTSSSPARLGPLLDAIDVNQTSDQGTGDWLPKKYMTISQLELVRKWPSHTWVEIHCPNVISTTNHNDESTINSKVGS